MTRTLPAIPQAEYRAFMLLDEVPSGCTLFEVRDEYSLPHIRFGESVVVDTTDTEPRNGEVYVIQWRRGSRIVCQANAYGPGQLFYEEGRERWRVGSIRKGPSYEALKRKAAEAAARGAIYVYPGWCEAPIDRDHLQEMLVGRVIGIYNTADKPMRDVTPPSRAT